MSDLDCIFAPEGPLVAAVASFRPRPRELEVAQRIAAAIAGNKAKKGQCAIAF